MISAEEPTDPNHPVWIDPEGDETPDNPLDITGATVGQIARITAVDATGAPTAWEPVDMAGGDSGDLELIRYIEITETVAQVDINTDDNGQPIELKEVKIYMHIYFGADTNSKGKIWAFLNTRSSGSTTNYLWEFVTKTLADIMSNSDARYPAGYFAAFAPTNLLTDGKRLWAADVWQTTNTLPSTVSLAFWRQDNNMKGAYETHVLDAVRYIRLMAATGQMQPGTKIWVYGKKGLVE